MKIQLFLSFVIFTLSATLNAFEYSGRANTWSLYETDDTDATTIAVVRENGTLIGVVVGRDIEIECSKLGRTCEYQKLGSGDLERVTGEISSPNRETVGTKAKDTLLWNLGLDAKANHKQYSAKIHGDFRTSILGTRQNYGHDRFRLRLTDLYGEYSVKRYLIRAGRQTVTPGGILLDGASATYQFGPDHLPDAKGVGLFVGLAPDPISKMFSADFVTFGTQYRFIPNFAQDSETKFNIEGALIAQTYKGSMNRFYLSTRLHFTPIKNYSLNAYSNLELPWSGEDGSIKSSLLSIQNYWRPRKEWFFSLGLSQFRIDRNLQKEAIQWVTENSAQQTRVGNSLDRSHRYRLDFRASYKPFPAVQPFLKFRYERRTVDQDKQFENSSSPGSKELDFALLNRKNAYQGTFGIKLNLIDELITETSGSYVQRFQSRGYMAVQEFTWDPDRNWTATLSGQWVNSERTRSSSFPNGADVLETANDFYAGLGGMYRLRSDLKGILQYDFGNESDQGLGRRTTIHTVYVRLDYTF